jgi:hypothetical protein
MGNYDVTMWPTLQELGRGTGTPKFHGEHPWIIVDVPLNHLKSVHWHVTYVGYTVLPCYISMFHVSSSLFWCLGDLPRYHRGPRHSEPMATTLSMLKVKRLLVRLHGWFVFHVGCWWNVWCIIYDMCSLHMYPTTWMICVSCVWFYIMVFSINVDLDVFSINMSLDRFQGTSTGSPFNWWLTCFPVDVLSNQYMRLWYGYVCM